MPNSSLFSEPPQLFHCALLQFITWAPTVLEIPGTVPDMLMLSRVMEDNTTVLLFVPEVGQGKQSNFC